MVAIEGKGKLIFFLMMYILFFTYDSRPSIHYRRYEALEDIMPTVRVPATLPRYFTLHHHVLLQTRDNSRRSLARI